MVPKERISMMTNTTRCKPCHLLVVQMVQLVLLCQCSHALPVVKEYTHSRTHTHQAFGGILLHNHTYFWSFSSLWSRCTLRTNWSRTTFSSLHDNKACSQLNTVRTYTHYTTCSQRCRAQNIYCTDVLMIPYVPRILVVPFCLGFLWGQEHPVI